MARDPLSLPALMKWPGGKNHLATFIERHLPEHEHYVEPFAGGAAVFFRKPLAPGDNVLGDKDRWNIELFNDLRRGRGLEGCGPNGFPATKAVFERAKKSKTACSKLKQSMMSFHGDRKTFFKSNKDTRRIGQQKLRKLPLYGKKLRKAHLVVGDFSKTMRRFDSLDTLHFLDPPWPLASGYSEQFYHGGTSAAARAKTSTKNDRKAFDPHHVMDVSSKMKGSVFVIYGDHPDVRAAFVEAKKRGWKIYAQKVTNSSGVGMRKVINLIAIKPPGALPKRKSASKRKRPRCSGRSC